MRHTSRDRNNRLRLQKIGKKLRQKAKAAKKAQKAGQAARRTPAA